MGFFDRFRNKSKAVSKFKMVTETGNGFYTWNGKIYHSDIVRACIRPKVKAVGKLVAKHIRNEYSRNGGTIHRLSATARVTEDASSKKRTVKIGGIGNFDNKKYLIRFVHEDNNDGDVRVTISGMNQSGWTLTFQKDAETVLNAEFKAMPCDSDGTLIIYTEEDATITQNHEG